MGSLRPAADPCNKVAHACFWRSWREGRMTPVIRCIILPGDV